jgi:ankyrin repeat protein
MMRLLDCVNCNGNTPAHDAAEQGNIALVHKLYAWGLRLDKQNNAGDIPADIADRKGDTGCADIIRMLSYISLSSEDSDRPASEDRPNNKEAAKKVACGLKGAVKKKKKAKKKEDTEDTEAAYRTTI